jgi:hypothetical protein
MRDKITVYGLLSKIYNSNTDMPKKINCCGYEYEWDDGYQDYLRTDDEKGLLLSFLDNHNDNLYYFLNDTVDIIKENKEIEKLDHFTISVGRVDDSNIEEYIQKLFEQQCEMFNKINEIINKLKKNK